MSIAVVVIAFLTKSSSDFSRVTVIFGTIGAMAALMWARLQMRTFVRLRCGPNVVNELIIDDGGPNIELPRAIRVSAESFQLKPDLGDPYSLDRVGLVLRNIDRVIISCPPQRRLAWAMTLKGANIEGEVLDDQVVLLGAQGARVIANHGLLLVSAGPLGLRAQLAKRLLDLSLASAALFILAPLSAMCAVSGSETSPKNSGLMRSIRRTQT